MNPKAFWDYFIILLFFYAYFGLISSLSTKLFSIYLDYFGWYQSNYYLLPIFEKYECFYPLFLHKASI